MGIASFLEHMSQSFGSIPFGRLRPSEFSLSYRYGAILQALVRGKDMALNADEARTDASFAPTVK
jgi:hypothetical protein